MTYSITASAQAVSSLEKVCTNVQTEAGIPEYLQVGNVILHNVFGKQCPFELAAIRYDSKAAQESLFAMQNGEVCRTQSRIGAAVRCVKMNESDFLLALRKDAKRIFIEFKKCGLIK